MKQLNLERMPPVSDPGFSEGHRYSVNCLPKMNMNETA